MVLRIQIDHPDVTVKEYFFDNHKAEIRIGRDGAMCDVLFPPNEVSVGREHCVIKRTAGRYRWVLNRKNAVFVNSKRVRENDELQSVVCAQFGKRGPTVLIQTEFNESLLSTAGNSSDDGLWTVSSRIQKSNARVWRLACTCLFLLATASLMTYGLRIRDKREIALVARQVDLLQTLTSSEQERLEKIAMKIGAIEASKATSFDRLRVVAENAKKSVYVVLLQDKLAARQPIGTAWVIAPGKLATNAHVAKILGNMPSGFALIARACSGSHEFQIVDAQIHPGYREFRDLWAAYDPSRRLPNNEDETIRPGADGCDVALLNVSNGDAAFMGPPLPIAGTSMLLEIKPGEPATYVGYPVEGLSLGGVNLTTPNPIMHFGYITAVLDEFGDATIDHPYQTLLQHSLPSAGGASGSPILNAEGKVIGVHSAGNALRVLSDVRLDSKQDRVNSSEEAIGSNDSNRQYVRINSSANLGYAQRIDLVDELLNEAVAAKQTARRKHWANSIAKHFERRDASRRIASAESIKEDVLSRMRRDGEYKASASRLSSFYDKELNLTGSAESTSIVPMISLLHAGEYLLLFTREKPDPFTVQISLSESFETSSILTESQFGVDSCQVAIVSMKEAGNLPLRLLSGHAEYPTRVYVWQLEQTRLNSEDLNLLLLRRARTSRPSVFRETTKAKQVLLQKIPQVMDSNEKIHGMYINTVELDVETSGNYLMTLLGPPNSKVGIDVDANLDPRPKSASFNSVVWRYITVRKPGKVTLRILSNAQTDGLQLRGYFLED